MKNILKLFILILLTSSTMLFANNTQDTVFTNDEKIWLKKQIPVTYVYDIDWAPFEWKMK